ncbi:MAG: peptidylprolyl isomerase [Candidatus Poseidoniaceae archaeon]|nr:peptidylprolyl isomerase [Candidatus Poseidoniaceae archaeon]
MADKNMSESWQKAEKLITSGKAEGALLELRETDGEGTHPTTLRIAGEATWAIAKGKRSKPDYRKAASLLRESVKNAPKDKKANSSYNDVLNEMQDLGFSETSLPRLINDGTPTFAGMIAMGMALVLVLAGITVANTEQTYTASKAYLNITWTDDSGDYRNEVITIQLNPDLAPIHVENFVLNAEKGNYDGTIFHRIIGDNAQTPQYDPFMIQGGDFTNGDGTGGHAAKWYGYCNGEAMESSSDCAENSWSIPDEASNGLQHTAGALSMAKTANANTGGSQFFIVPSDGGASHLDGKHTVFGYVTDGIEHIDSIVRVPTEAGDKPTNDVTLVSVTTDSVEKTPWYRTLF